LLIYIFVEKRQSKNMTIQGKRLLIKEITQESEPKKVKASAPRRGRRRKLMFAGGRANGIKSVRR